MQMMARSRLGRVPQWLPLRVACGLRTADAMVVILFRGQQSPHYIMGLHFGPGPRAAVPSQQRQLPVVDEVDAPGMVASGSWDLVGDMGDVLSMRSQDDQGIDQQQQRLEQISNGSSLSYQLSFLSDHSRSTPSSGSLSHSSGRASSDRVSSGHGSNSSGGLPANSTALAAAAVVSTQEAHTNTDVVWSGTMFVCRRCNKPPLLPSDTRPLPSFAYNMAARQQRKIARANSFVKPVGSVMESTSLSLSQCSELGTQGRTDTGDLELASLDIDITMDGFWALESGPGDVPTWLRSLEISGNAVVDGAGDLLKLQRDAAGHFMLEGGRMTIKDGCLWRQGRTGGAFQWSLKNEAQDQDTPSSSSETNLSLFALIP